MFFLHLFLATKQIWRISSITFSNGLDAATRMAATLAKQLLDLLGLPLPTALPRNAAKRRNIESYGRTFLASHFLLFSSLETQTYCLPFPKLSLSIMIPKRNFKIVIYTHWMKWKLTPMFFENVWLCSLWTIWLRYNCFWWFVFFGVKIILVRLSRA